MNLTNIAGLIVVIVCAGLMVGFAQLSRKRPQDVFRKIPAYEHLRHAIDQAVEGGSRLHVSLGSSSITSPSNISALAGLSVLSYVARVSAISDQPPIATSGESTLAILSQDTIRSAYRDANAIQEYDPTQGRLTGLTPFSYAVGTFSVFHDEQVSANMLMGSFQAEAGLLADSASQAETTLVAGSESLTAQALFYAAAEDPLIGEEIFAGRAYLDAAPVHSASLRAQDILRWVVLVALVAGSVLTLIGLL